MAQVRIGIGYSDASSQSSSEADRHWEFWATKSRESFVHELSTVFYDLSATITAFKSWIPRRAFLRFKYRSTAGEGGLGSAGITPPAHSGPSPAFPVSRFLERKGSWQRSSLTCRAAERATRAASQFYALRPRIGRAPSPAW